MIKGLSQHKKVIRDFKLIEKELNALPDGVVKDKGFQLFGKLKLQANMIDQLHTTVGVRDISAKSIKEHAEQLSNIRSEILKLIKNSKI